MSSLINISRVIIVALCLLCPKIMLAQIDYDTNDNGLIEVSTLEQLNAIRWDLDGDGAVDSGDQATYGAAFPMAVGGTTYGAITCNGGCSGYELTTSLDFEDADGNGTADDPSKWSENCSGANCVTGTQADRITTGNIGWEPIGNNYTDATRFTAIFNGGSNTISNLYIDRTSADHVGLFGYTSSGAELTSLGIEGGSVKGNSSVGSLVGVSKSTISDCYAINITVTQTESFGNAGGLVGTNFEGTISACYATGAVMGTGVSANVGGLVGNKIKGTISACYATGNVMETERSNETGGLVGVSFDGKITACYAIGSVTASGANSRAGGLVGWNSSRIKACYATGTVMAPGTGAKAGGLVGKNNGGGITDSYFDHETAGADFTSSDNYAKSTSELRSPTDYDDNATPGDGSSIYENWNIDVDSNLSRGVDDATMVGDATPDDVWYFGTNIQYPVLKVDFDESGDATSAEFGDQPTTVSVNIAPVFVDAPYTFTQNEEVVIDTPVSGTTEIFATDADGDPLEYSLTNNEGGRFQIDPQTGIISNAEIIDYEALESLLQTNGITLVVQVSDNATPPNTAMANVTITITDVEESTFSVPSVESNIVVYPNPALDVVRLTGLSSTKRYAYSLYSLTGIEMLSGLLETGTIDISTLTEGQYVLVLLTEEKELLRTRLLIVK